MRLGGPPLHFHSGNTHLHSLIGCGVSAFTSLPTLAIVHPLPLATLMELKYFPLDFVLSSLTTKDSYVLFFTCTCQGTPPDKYCVHWPLRQKPRTDAHNHRTAPGADVVGLRGTRQDGMQKKSLFPFNVHL